MLTGLLIALLGAAIVAIAVITMAKLFEIIEKKIKQHAGTQPITGDLEELLSGEIKKKLDGKQRVSLDALQQKLKKKPLYQARACFKTIKVTKPKYRQGKQRHENRKLSFHTG